MYTLLAVAVTFILLIFLVLYNFSTIQQVSKESKIEEKENDKKFEEQSSKLDDKLDELRDEIYDRMDSNINDQKKIDTKQNQDIDANMVNIDGALSNITNNIEPQLLIFDGNFKSLESIVSENKGGLAELQEEISTFNSEQLTWNDQFSNQQASLVDKLNEIQNNDYSEKIANINKKMKDDLIPNMQFNTQSIANISKKIDTDLVNDIDDLSNKYMTLSSNAHDLSTQTLRLADIVDTHDLLIKSN